MIETASAFAQREMLPEARQALQRARGALAQRSDVGPAHWCNACLVALEIAARGGDVQGMEAEAAQLRSLSGGGQYWSEQARARIGMSSGRVDPARLDRVFAVLGGTALPTTPPPAADPSPNFPAARPEGRGVISPTPRPSAPPEPPRGGTPEPAPEPSALPEPAFAPEPAPAHVPAPAPDAAPALLVEAVPACPADVAPARPADVEPARSVDVAPAAPVAAAPARPADIAPAISIPAEPVEANPTWSVETKPVQAHPTPPADAQPTPVEAKPVPAEIPHAGYGFATPAQPRADLPPSVGAPEPPAAPRPAEPRPAEERVYRGVAWGGAAWQGAVPEEPPADRLPAESISTSAPQGDPFYFAGEMADEWMDRLAELSDVAGDDLPLIFVHDGTGPVDARLRVTPDRTDAQELLRSFVDHMTCWRDDVSDEEAENFYDLGTSLLDMEQWESAVKVFDQAMRNPGTRVAAAEGYLKALMGMGGHHAAFGAAGMALNHLADASEPLSGILFLRGQAAEETGDPREARRCYTEALRIDRFYADARERLAALEE
jgi:hypothetical protein